MLFASWRQTIKLQLQRADNWRHINMTTYKYDTLRPLTKYIFCNKNNWS